LQRITSALSEALTPSDIARVVSTRIASAVGAGRAYLAVPLHGADSLRVVAPVEDSTPAKTSTVMENSPLAVSFRRGPPLWLCSPQEQRAVALSADVEGGAMACLPLELMGRKLGAIAFVFDTPRPFPAHERALMEDLARQTALAFDRSRFFEAAQMAVE